MIPLILRLKKAMHKEVAKAQDMVVEPLYRVFNGAVLHGGTAIWRCYNGNRFSEDIDVYIPKNVDKLELLFEFLERKGFGIEKKKIGANSLFSSLNFNNTIIRFEALFKKVEGHLKEYETVESNLITVYTLTPEGLIKEKVDTYLKRFKIRDLYDIFFLLRYVQDKNKIKHDLSSLLKKFKMPIDENELKTIIIDGLTPTTEKMLEYIKGFT